MCGLTFFHLHSRGPLFDMLNMLVPLNPDQCDYLPKPQNRSKIFLVGSKQMPIAPKWLVLQRIRNQF